MILTIYEETMDDLAAGDVGINPKHSQPIYLANSRSFSQSLSQICSFKKSDPSGSVSSYSNHNQTSQHASYSQSVSQIYHLEKFNPSPARLFQRKMDVLLYSVSQICGLKRSDPLPGSNQATENRDNSPSMSHIRDLQRSDRPLVDDQLIRFQNIQINEHVTRAEIYCEIMSRILSLRKPNGQSGVLGTLMEENCPTQVLIIVVEMMADGINKARHF